MIWIQYKRLKHLQFSHLSFTLICVNQCNQWTIFIYNYQLINHSHKYNINHIIK